MKIMETKKLTLSYGGEEIISALDLEIPKGKITVLIGRNGCGKSTLLRSMARLLKPKQGSVILDGKQIAKRSTKEVARHLAILPQSPVAPEGLTVLQLVRQGRYPHQSWLQQWSREDELIVNRALQVTQMAEFAYRSVDTLSGGQRQRAWIAMILAQGTNVILLDEPTTYLDLAHQIEILDLLNELNKKEQRTIIMVLHDLNLACRYAHHVVVIHQKGVYVQGKPKEVCNVSMVKAVFGMDCQIITDPLFGTPICIPYGRGEIHPCYPAKAGGFGKR